MQSKNDHSFKVFFLHGWKTQEKANQTDHSYLLKYNPKFCSKISLDKIDTSIALKVKGLKRLHHFAVKLNENQRNDLTSIWLQKVRKDLKSIVKTLRDDEHGESEIPKWYGRSFQEVKWSSGIERMEIPGYFLRDPFQGPTESMKNSKEEVNRILRYLTHAKSVKKIDLSISQQMNEFMVNRIKASKRLLAKVNDTKARVFCFESLNVPGLKSQNSMIARHLEHLTIDKLEEENLQVFAEISKALEGLQTLNISLIKSAKLYENSVSEYNQMSASLFASIERLSRLERLSLKFSGAILGWIDSFALPKSLKELTLTFSAGNNIFIALASQEGGLQNAPVLKNFYQKIQELPFLENLQLVLSPLFYDDPNNVLSFVVPLLKGIPKLKSLKLALPSFPSDYSTRGFVLDFSSVFEAIQHLAPKLEELQIEFPQYLRAMVFALDSQYNFTNLRKMSISGNFRSHLDLKQVLVNLLGGDFGPVKTKRKIEIKTITVPSQQDFERLEEAIKEVNDSIELKAEIKIDVKILELDSVVEIMLC